MNIIGSAQWFLASLFELFIGQFVFYASQATAQARISLGSSQGASTLNANLDIGQAIADIVISGTIKDAGTKRDIAFGDLGLISLTGNGNDKMQFANGYELKQYLFYNRFISSQVNSGFLENYIRLPQYRNVGTLLQRRFTFLDTGPVSATGINNLNLSVQILANSLDTGGALTDANVFYQPFTTSLTGSTASLEVKSYQFSIGSTGLIDIPDLPRVGNLSQLLVLPPVGVDARAEGVIMDELKLILNNTEVNNGYSDTINRELIGNANRRVPTYGMDDIVMSEGSYMVFDPTSDGFGDDTGGKLAAINVETSGGVSSFRVRLDITSKGTDADPKVIILTQSIVV